MLTRRALAGLLVVIGALAAAPAHAADRIFWTAGDGAIRATDPAGGGPVETLYSGQSAGGLDIDLARDRLIWSAGPDKAIRFGPLDGSGPVEDLTATATDPRGVAVDQAGGRLLWLEYYSLNSVPLTGGPTTTLSDCCLDGSNHFPEHGSVLAVDDANGRVYFNHGEGGNSIISAPLDGSSPPEGLYGVGIDTYAGGIAVDPVGGFIYWTSENEGPWPDGLRIQRAPIDGSGPVEVLYHGQGRPIAIAVDNAAGELYWTEHGWTGGSDHPVQDLIRRAPLNGSGPVETVVETPTPSHIVLLRTPLSTGAPVVTGGATTGSRLSCGEGTWAADVRGSFVHRPPVSAFAYRWQREGSDIAGANQSTYTPLEIGDYRCIVTATNAAGTTDSASVSRTIAEHATPNPGPGPIQTLSLGRAFLGRSGAIFVPVTCTLPTDATLTLRFRKPTHGFRKITRSLHLRAGASRTRIVLSRKQRRKLLRIRRLRVTATLTSPSANTVSRDSTLSGRTVFRR